ncbi:hypothetical protein Hanom_Chr08g00711981 [Helianthus anomalus]
MMNIDYLLPYTWHRNFRRDSRPRSRVMMYGPNHSPPKSFVFSLETPPPFCQHSMICIL